MTRTPEFWDKVNAWLNEQHPAQPPFAEECRVKGVMPGLLYRQQIAGGLVCSVVQLKDEATDTRAQNLTMVIEDTANGRWVSLKLSSLRRVWEFMEKISMKEARRLNAVERDKIDNQKF